MFDVMSTGRAGAGLVIPHPPAYGGAPGHRFSGRCARADMAANATISPFPPPSDAMSPLEQRLAALIDPARLDAQFVVKDLGADDGLEWLSLAPKQESDAAFRSARLGFGDSGLVKMQVVDNLGQRTEIHFAGWKRNPSFPASTFRYAPPKGVDVIGGE